MGAGGGSAGDGSEGGGLPQESERAAPTRETLERVRRRERAALSELFEYSFDRIYGLAVRLLGDRSMAEDAVQEVFLKVHRAAHQLDPARDPLRWMTAITYNVCRDHWRSFAGKMEKASVSINGNPALRESLSHEAPSPEDEALRSERERSVQQALMELPEPLRTVVILRDFEGWSHDEIAGMIGASGPAVRKRYSRALSRLAELLEGLPE
jgi:RNA polymerase sigma factor (sigma-70 family)